MNILLICAAGMSTSLLVKKMQDEADKRSLSVNITARPVAELENIIDEYDLILLGPQLRYKEKYVKEIAQAKNKKYALIPPQLYGMVDGKGVLDLALSLEKE